MEPTTFFIIFFSTIGICIISTFIYFAHKNKLMIRAIEEGATPTEARYIFRESNPTQDLLMALQNGGLYLKYDNEHRKDKGE